jgi:UDP-glucose 4-epimerase
MVKGAKKASHRNESGKTSAGRRVLLTGAAGFVGSNLLKRLKSDARYERLVAVDLERPPFKLLKTKFYKVDLTHPRADEMLLEILSEEKPDIVVHTGFYQRPIEDTTYAHEVNSIGSIRSPVR